MTAETRHPSDDWRALAASEDLDDAEEVAASLARPSAELLGSLMGDVVERVIGVLLMGTPRPRQEALLARLRAASPRAAAHGSVLPGDGRGLLAASTLFVSLGVSAPVEEPHRLTAAWAPRAAEIVGRLRNDVCHDWALACAAHGLDDLVEVFLDAPEPSPGAATLARVVVRAGRDTDAGRAGVGAAWQSFVDGFPAAYTAGEVWLSSLLHAAWAVHVRVWGGEPRGILGAIEEATGLTWDPR